MTNKKAVSTLVATVLLILLAVISIGIVWQPLSRFFSSLSFNEVCTNTGLEINSISGYTCYNDELKQAIVMISGGKSDLAGFQVGLKGEGKKTNYVVRDEGLVLYLPFDEQVGDFATDMFNVVEGVDCLVSGAEWTIGKFSNSLEFNGADSSVNCGNDSKFNLGSAATVEAWVKVAKLTAGERQTIISKPNSFSFEVNDDGGLIVNIPPIISTPATTLKLSENKWHHIAFTFDSTTASIFIDGNQELSIESSGNFIDSLDDLSIGYSFSAQPSPFNGTIDEVRIYPEALPAPTIKKHFSREYSEYYSRIPKEKEELTLLFFGDNLESVEIAPIVKKGEVEKICSVSGIATLGKCI